VLVAILSAARSTTDLHALIRASPAVYKVFRSAKRALLVSIVTRDLGPALRDAVAATLITPLKTRCSEESERVIQQYEALLRSDGRGAARGLPYDAAVALVRVNRSVQFLVDEYAVSRLPELRKIHPDAAGPLTANERQRLAQAMLRHQVTTRINFDDCRPHGIALIDKFFSLFRPWESHQLVDAHCFMNNMLWHAFRYCERRHELRLFEPSLLVVPPTPLEIEKDTAQRDLGALHRKLVTERDRVAADPGVVAEAEWFPRSKPPGMIVRAHCKWLAAGPLPTQVWDDRVTKEQYWRDELYWREDAMPPLVPADNDDNDDATAAPPFAWVDGHGGLDCQRWGENVRRAVVPTGQDTTVRQRIWMQEKLEKWRWLGFVFWDRARIELLKTRLPVYVTGWLTVAPPPDAECDLPEMVRGPPRRRVVRYVGQ
jgi:hypothetical protein